MSLKHRVAALEQRVPTSPTSTSSVFDSTADVLRRLLELLSAHHRERLEEVMADIDAERPIERRDYERPFKELIFLSFAIARDGKPFPADGGLSVVEDWLPGGREYERHPWLRRGEGT